MCFCLIMVGGILLVNLVSLVLFFVFLVLMWVIFLFRCMCLVLRLIRFFSGISSFSLFMIVVVVGGVFLFLVSYWMLFSFSRNDSEVLKCLMCMWFCVRLVCRCSGICLDGVMFSLLCM